MASSMWSPPQNNSWPTNPKMPSLRASLVAPLHAPPISSAPAGISPERPQTIPEIGLRSGSTIRNPALGGGSHGNPVATSHCDHGQGT